MKHTLQLISYTLLLQLNIQAQQFLLTGTYTQSGSKGIYVHQWNTASGTTTGSNTIAASNPSFLALAPNSNMLFAVNEDAPGSISAFRLNKADGTATLLNKVTAGGNHPCYIAVHPSGQWLVAGNYSSGNFISYRIRANGLAATPLQTIQHQGNSVNKSRQSSPHVHTTVFAANGKELYVADLGTDRLHVYKTSKSNGIVQELQQVQLPPGSGPRHLAIHPGYNIIYVLNELTATVSILQRQKKRWQVQQTINTLPENFEGDKGAADIHLSPDGRFLYCSNRGSANSISIFKVLQNGGLELQGIKATLGIRPRNFTIDPSGTFLLVANQDSNEIVVFRRNQETGNLTDTGHRIAVPQPVCLTWVR